jgi:hypothetical protein
MAEELREGRGALPELRPWREVGWIFRDGQTIAIERQDERTRARSVQRHEEEAIAS